MRILSGFLVLLVVLQIADSFSLNSNLKKRERRKTVEIKIEDVGDSVILNEEKKKEEALTLKEEQNKEDAVNADNGKETKLANVQETKQANLQETKQEAETLKTFLSEKKADEPSSVQKESIVSNNLATNQNDLDRNLKSIKVPRTRTLTFKHTPNPFLLSLRKEIMSELDSLRNTPFGVIQMSAPLNTFAKTSGQGENVKTLSNTRSASKNLEAIPNLDQSFSFSSTMSNVPFTNGRGVYPSMNRVITFSGHDQDEKVRTLSNAGSSKTYDEHSDGTTIVVSTAGGGIPPRFSFNLPIPNARLLAQKLPFSSIPPIRSLIHGNPYGQMVG